MQVFQQQEWGTIWEQAVDHESQQREENQDQLELSIVSRDSVSANQKPAEGGVQSSY